MKLGFVISMYDEINTVNSTINNMKKFQLVKLLVLECIILGEDQIL